ncbi:hypothetical protein ILYODFUR_026797 [Ilyodon furcidens]|uniref:Uncharacterized protein n=1 Tax=Ilyodon furcidens TaxID=33524 RepID=A0ABV0UVG3_9TELE
MEFACSPPACVYSSFFPESKNMTIRRNQLPQVLTTCPTPASRLIIPAQKPTSEPSLQSLWKRNNEWGEKEGWKEGWTWQKDVWRHTKNIHFESK